MEAKAGSPEEGPATTSSSSVRGGGGLRAEVTRVVALCASEGQGDPVALFHGIASAMHGISAAIREAEASGLSVEAISEAVAPVRALHAASPFIRRMQDWPRGLPGDYETIEHLCRAKNECAQGSVGWAFEQYALTCAAAQQHRNKLAWQERRLREIADSTSAASVVLIACGGARDVAAAAKHLAERTTVVTLNDIDEQALALARERLSVLGSQLRLVPGDVFRSTKALQTHGPFDASFAGGLFDYLSDRQAEWLLQRMKGLVRPGGSVNWTNIGTPHLFRPWMEYMASWKVIPRSEEQSRSIMVRAGFDGAKIAFDRDATGLTLLVSATV